VTPADVEHPHAGVSEVRLEPRAVDEWALGDLTDRTGDRHTALLSC
jgi:hypothetical protein